MTTKQIITRAFIFGTGFLGFAVIANLASAFNTLVS